MRTVKDSVTLPLNGALNQAKLNEIESFRTGLKSNERVLIGFGEGNKIIFSRHTESSKEKSLRQIGNFLNRFKNNAGINRSLNSLSAKADHIKNWAPEISHIHAHVSEKFHASHKISLSAHNFQALANSLSQKLAVPVFDNLNKDGIKESLKDLSFQNKTAPHSSPEVTYLARPGENLKQVSEEFSAFFKFAADQADGRAGLYPDQKAVAFAERLQKMPNDTHENLAHLFGKTKFEAISTAADELLKFVKPKSA